MTKIFQDPIFIPKILDKAMLNSGVEFSHALIDAHYLLYREGVLDEIKEKCSNVIIDPVTHYLQFSGWYEKPSFKELPYSSITDVQRVLADPTYRLSSLIIPVVDFQINYNAEFIIAPYFCTDDINSTLFTNNLTILGETLYYLKGKDNHPKVFAPICIGSNVLRDRKLTNYIIDCYKDNSFYPNISGYFILITDFDDRTADEDQLLGLADITYQLSQEKDVIINHLGGFGDVLNAIGLSAFVSSPGGGETFSLKQMQQGNVNARSRKHDQWRYVPELFDYINEEELGPDKINYQCTCIGCSSSSSFSSIYAARKVHFLIKKSELVSEMSGKSIDERKNIMIQKLDNAIIKVQEYKRRFGSDLKINHLIKWKKILEISGGWNYQQNDVELEKLLQELD